MHKPGYLLINLGTPDAPEPGAVRRYLNEFLMDEYVITAPWIIRRLLVSLFILPFRPRRSAQAYAKIWTEDGSPLLLNTARLADELGSRLSGPVVFAMRYGEPNIADAVAKLRAQGIDELIIIPLYPQYADSTVTTSVRKASLAARDLPHRVLSPFYQDTRYVDASAALIRRHLPSSWDHLLMSFHGLPEQHLVKTDPTQAHCLQSPDCCEVPSKAHATCYRHQSFVTSRMIANALNLSEDEYSVSFQSRLGRLPWLQPYTDEVLTELPARGVKDLVVACPAFVADNLETLEEIAMQGRETFLTAGGRSFTVVPCLNCDPDWLDGLAAIVRDYTSIASNRTSL